MKWNETGYGVLASVCALAVGLTACGSNSSGGTGGYGASGGGGYGATGGAGGSTGGSAGAGTGGSSGASSCDTYCATVMANCQGDNAQYSGLDQCLGSCAAFPQSQDQTGNTVGCRTLHAQNAADDPTVHCPHAGPGGDGVCGAACDGYCQIAMMYCTAANGAQVYTDLADCQADCQAHGATPRYTANVQAGDSAACLLYHAQEASVVPADHCNGDLAKTSPTCKAP